MTHRPHKHSISKAEINVLPLTSYTGAIHVIDSDAKMDAAARSLGSEKILGFDTETRPSFKVGESYSPSLIQLAASDLVYIFQLQHIRSYALLAGILADGKHLKVGIAVGDDLKKLRQMLTFEPAGFVDLGSMAHAAGIKNLGIRSLAGMLFGYRISKGTKTSRWDAPTLTEAQIVYAATDAWMCREIYFGLTKAAT